MPRIATKNSDATESRMNINVHAEGTSIPIILTAEQCTSTTWGALCKQFVEKSLTTADSRLILHILTNISPNERLPHYVFRFGDGNSSIFRVNWSPAGVPGFKRVPLATGYIEVNVILKPVGSGAPTNMAKPHLPVRPAGANVPSSIDVDLCISVVSAHPSDEFLYPTTHQPFPSNIARTSLVYLTEHKSFPGCVDSFSIVAADGVNNLLPGNARMPDAPSAAAAIAITTTETTATTGKKRKAPSKDGATPTKAKSSKKTDTSKSHDDDGAKKPAAKDGKKKGGAAAAAKKSPPEESAAKLKSPPKKSGADMIRLYEEAKAKELEGKSSGAKSDTVSIPKVISSKKTTKISPKKDSGKSNAAEDSAKKASAAAAKEKSGDGKAPSADAGNEMIRLYEEAKAKELEEKSSAAKSDTASIPKVISSKKTTKISPKKDSGKSNAAEDSTKKASAAAKEKSGDGKAPSADAGNEMIRLYNESKAKENAAENKKTPSKKSDDPTKSSTSKKAKGSSKKDEAKSDEGKSTKKPSATEEAKSAKKKAKEADADGNKASKKKRKAPTDGESLDAPKSPSKKKAKTSKADESTPSKSDGEKSAAAKDGESEKKRGPKPKDYSDIPSEPVKDLPEGWTLKTIPRSVGDKYDQKWYSPGGIAFRTKKGATGFIEIFNRVNDEAEAYAVYQKEEKEAKELKKMEKEAKKKKEAESIVV